MAKRRTSRVVPAVGAGKRGPDGHIGYLLRQAQAAMRLAYDTSLSKLGLTAPQFLVLNLIDAYPGASGAELARTAQLTPQTMNLILRKLEREGLIERDEHETHGRVLRLTLTPKGTARLRNAKTLSDKIERRVLALADADTERKLRHWLVDVAVALTGA
ncbi:MAG TPA: MarR family transcriptional regulator [Gemmatimonadaceae bacterium]|jgi:DNA-binding MarR family transcriptional regulator